VIVDVGVERGELLERLHSSKPQHHTLAPSERQVAVLNPVVGPAPDLLLLRIADFVHRCLVGAQAIGRDRFW